MYRQYFRLFKYSMNLGVIENNHCLTNNVRKKLYTFSALCCQKQLKPEDSPRALGFQIGPTSLFSSTILSNHCRNRSFSQQNIKTEHDAMENTDTSAVSSNPSASTQSDASENKSDVSQSKMMNQFNLFEDIDYQQITDGDEAKLNEFKLLMLEIDVMQQDGMCVPSRMSTNEWKELFILQTKSQRRKYLNFLFKNEMKSLADKRKKELKRLARLEFKEEITDTPSDQIKYGFQGSTIFLRIYETTMNAFDNYRLLQAMMFGQDLVIDCGFFNDMNTMENRLCCKQLVYLFAENRISKEPFNLHFCNLKKNSNLFQYLKNSIPTIEDPAYPINIHEEHYLDLFPKQKLVYLTPHCRTELKEFNHDDVYIVGAIVDRVNQFPLTLAKAKSEGLRMAQLPLDRYLDWNIGNKSLTINQVVNIMHDAQVTGDWNIAFKHVPRRKIRLPGEPIRDSRKSRKRGTTFQPPQNFIKSY